MVEEKKEIQVSGTVDSVENKTTKNNKPYKLYKIGEVVYGQFSNINEEIKVGDKVFGTATDDGTYKTLKVLGKVEQIVKKEDFKGAETVTQRKDDYPFDDYSRGAIFGMLVNNTLEEMRDQGKCFSDSSDCEARFNATFDRLKKVVLDKRKKEMGE